MVRISEIVSQNPWWKHGKEFTHFDTKLAEAKRQHACIPMMKEPKTFMWFYYNTQGKEVDNILRIDESYHAIEVKYQGKVTTSDIWKIPQCKEHMILTKEDLKTDGKVILAPVDMFLALLKKSNRTL